MDKKEFHTCGSWLVWDRKDGIIQDLRDRVESMRRENEELRNIVRESLLGRVNRDQEIEALKVDLVTMTNQNRDHELRAELLKTEIEELREVQDSLIHNMNTVSSTGSRVSESLSTQIEYLERLLRANGFRPSPVGWVQDPSMDPEPLIEQGRKEIREAIRPLFQNIRDQAHIEEWKAYCGSLVYDRRKNYAPLCFREIQEILDGGPIETRTYFTAKDIPALKDLLIKTIEKWGGK